MLSDLAVILALDQVLEQVPRCSSHPYNTHI